MAIDINTLIGLLTSGAGIGLVGVLLGKVLNSPQSKNVEEALAAKLAAETEVAIATADRTHNALLHEIVHAAMSYAETHASEVVAKYGSKFNSVIAKVTSDPRIAPLGLPTEAITSAIEATFLAYFKDLGAADNAGKPTVKPQDGIGGIPTGAGH